MRCTPLGLDVPVFSLYFTGMDATISVTRALQRCVEELTTATEAALATGDFDSVIRVTEVLKRVSGLLDSWCPPGAECAAPPLSSELGDVATTSRPESRPVPKCRSRGKQQPYPRFRRDGSYLVKTGWSKKSREEYEHRAPVDAVFTIASRLDDMTASGGAVAADDVAGALSQDGATEVPSYQLYLVLAWMRAEQLLNRIGRTGYTAVFPRELAAKARARWDEMGT